MEALKGHSTSAADRPTDVNPGVWIEARCAEAGLSVSELARRARIARSTIYRWKHGHSPYLDTFRRLEAIIDDFWAGRGGRD